MVELVFKNDADLGNNDTDSTEKTMVESVIKNDADLGNNDTDSTEKTMGESVFKNDADLGNNDTDSTEKTMVESVFKNDADLGNNDTDSNIKEQKKTNKHRGTEKTNKHKGTEKTNIVIKTIIVIGIFISVINFIRSLKNNPSSKNNPSPIDCQVSEWINVGPCSCFGYQNQERKENRSSAHGGKKCPTLKQKIRCEDPNCIFDADFVKMKMLIKSLSVELQVISSGNYDSIYNKALIKYSLSSKDKDENDWNNFVEQGRTTSKKYRQGSDSTAMAITQIKFLLIKLPWEIKFILRSARSSSWGEVNRILTKLYEKTTSIYSKIEDATKSFLIVSSSLNDMSVELYQNQKLISSSMDDRKETLITKKENLKVGEWSVAKEDVALYALYPGEIERRYVSFDKCRKLCAFTFSSCYAITVYSGRKTSYNCILHSKGAWEWSYSGATTYYLLNSAKENIKDFEAKVQRTNCMKKTIIQRYKNVEKLFEDVLHDVNKKKQSIFSLHTAFEDVQHNVNDFENSFKRGVYDEVRFLKQLEFQIGTLIHAAIVISEHIVR